MPDYFFIREMQRQDWPQVAHVYAEGIATGNATFESSAPSWEEWDASHLRIPRLVAQRNREVLGFAALMPVSRRAVYRGVAEVSVYIAAEARRNGIGRALLRTVIDAAEDSGIWTLQGSVFAENLASLALCESLGFRRVGVREMIGAMNGRWRDTILLERRSAKVGISSITTPV